MRLITRQYGITFVDVKLIKMLFSDNRNWKEQQKENYIVVSLRRGFILQTIWIFMTSGL